MSKELFSFEADIETLLLVDALPDQIVIWLSGPRNNELTLRVYEDKWLSLKDPKVDAALAMYGRSGSCLEVLYNRSKDRRILRAIAANPAITPDIKRKILVSWSARTRAGDDPGYYLFMNPDLGPGDLMGIILGDDYRGYPYLAQKYSEEAFQLFSMTLRRNPDWVKNKLWEINNCALIPFLVRLLVKIDLGKHPGRALTIVDILNLILSQEFIHELVFDEYRISSLELDWDRFDRSLPVAEVIEEFLGSAKGKDQYTLKACVDVVIKVISAVAEGGRHLEWRRSFSTSKFERFRFGFYSTARVTEIFGWSEQIKFVDEKVWSEQESSPKYMEFKKEFHELIGEGDDDEFLRALTENRNFYNKPEHRLFLLKIGRYVGILHSLARTNSDFRSIIDDDLKMDELTQSSRSQVDDIGKIQLQIHQISQTLSFLEEKMAGSDRSNEPNKVSSEMSDNLIGEDLSELKAGLKALSWKVEAVSLSGLNSQKSYFGNLIRAVLGIR
jgi:hypothetical protein